MKTKELREKIKNAGGKIEIEGLKFQYTEGSDVDIYDEYELVAYISSSRNDDDLASEAASAVSAIKHINVLNKIAIFFGIEVNGVKPITVTKEVQVGVDESEKHKLAGKVEAYENILLKRELTVGR